MNSRNQLTVLPMLLLFFGAASLAPADDHWSDD